MLYRRPSVQRRGLNIACKADLAMLMLTYLMGVSENMSCKHRRSQNKNKRRRGTITRRAFMETLIAGGIAISVSKAIEEVTWRPPPIELTKSTGAIPLPVFAKAPRVFELPTLDKVCELQPKVYTVNELLNTVQVPPITLRVERVVGTTPVWVSSVTATLGDVLEMLAVVTRCGWQITKDKGEDGWCFELQRKSRGQIGYWEAKFRRWLTDLFPALHWTPKQLQQALRTKGIQWAMVAQRGSRELIGALADLTQEQLKDFLNRGYILIPMRQLTPAQQQLLRVINVSRRSKDTRCLYIARVGAGTPEDILGLRYCFRVGVARNERVRELPPPDSHTIERIGSFQSCERYLEIRNLYLPGITPSNLRDPFMQVDAPYSSARNSPSLPISNLLATAEVMEGLRKIAHKRRWRNSAHVVRELIMARVNVVSVRSIWGLVRISFSKELEEAFGTAKS